ncbi:MAG: peptidoglycan DD-metalloendopeptidase family protein, partial [Myxococcota bacterium]|nr:peptidoglycan DD-metalloendopeptidase family protein [Myxococcota bacterium]
MTLRAALWRLAHVRRRATERGAQALLRLTLCMPRLRRGSRRPLMALERAMFRAADARPEPVRTVDVPTPPPTVTLVDSIARGQTLGEVLGVYGLDGGQVGRLVDLIREFENPRRLQPGTVVRLAMRPAEPPRRISLQLDADRLLHLIAGEEDRWEARLDSVPVVVDTIRIGGRVASNLYNARLVGDVDRLASGESAEIVHALSRIFAWQVDFWRDVRSGDDFRLAVRREVRPDGSIRSARVLVAEYVNAGRSLVAIPFRVEEEGPVDYFDPEGEALRSQFLRAPLDFVRITSRFNLRRYHPILKRRRPHLGTDYGARPGTPVRATGAGVVTRAGWWGGYGRVVEIRHANNLRTRYAHLRGIARGVRVGARLPQGATVGYVGATGLATAPHLHYEFLRNGRQVNPSQLDLPRAEPVPTELRDAFERHRAEVLPLLAGLDPARDATRVGSS